MQKFLDQFKLTPMQKVDMEAFIFAQADKMVEGYLGGMWETRDVGGVHILIIPGTSEQVRLINYAFGGDIVTDRLTASAAFSSIVANWYMGLRHEQGRFPADAFQSFDTFNGAVGEAVYAKGSEINKRDFFNFTD